MTPKVISLAWGAAYLPFAPRLEASAKARGLDVKVTRWDGAGPKRPPLAWRQKPPFIIDILEREQRPALWVDVDFIFEDQVNLSTEADAMLYCSGAQPGVYEDGVMLWNPTPKSFETLHLWMKLVCDPEVKSTNDWLSVAVEETGLQVEPLPPEFHWVDRWYMAERHGRRRPIIREFPLIEKENPSCCGS